MPRFSFPIRVKVLLTVVILVMIVMGLNTATMANLFRKDKTTYMRDLTVVTAQHLAEESDALLRVYAANVRVFADVVYDASIDPATKQQIVQGLFSNYDDIIAITAQWGTTSPVTVFDSTALQQLNVTRQELLAHRQTRPVPVDLNDSLDVRLDEIKPGVKLALMTLEIPPTDETPVILLAASIDPTKLLAVTERSRGFRAMIMNREGQPIFDASADVQQPAPAWAKELVQGSEAAYGTTLEIVEDGVPKLLAYAPLADGALLATIRIPTSVVYLTARDLLSNLMIGALLLFAFAALASLLFARRLTRPLEQLSGAAQRVGKGQFEVTVTSESDDEIGALSHSFNQMTNELRERENKLEHANAALIQSEKLAAFGQLGAGIAHEVKNPLAGILGYAQLTLRKLEPDSPFRKNLDVIEKETRRCTDIISNLLKFARQETTETTETNINEVVNAAMTIVDHQLSIHNVRINRELDPDVPQIQASANQLQQVIMNFAINAQQAMGEKGGNLTLRTRENDGGTIVIEVEDDGPGIPMEIRGNIFDPFFTTKPAGQGTGLGLSVTYGIVRDHGGDIRIEDPPDGGTRFVVTLPIESTEVA
ncbi:MAG: HAMP domain-containing protein [Woeseiaceae bacterium]|nr:HAMP domain-containing protein [Gammaproteobacteria bacterium]NNF50387.1 HAMP domain-containing protein [Woeseiaceae bacterium]NNK25884.1 HAMP domain-containing protein [Woeseiaceae bacterium]